MPILRGAVTFTRFRVEPSEKMPSDTKRWLTRGLSSHAFEPINRKSDDDRAVGFVELEDEDATEFSTGALFYGERALFSFRVDTLKIPGAQMRAELEKWQKDFERENNRKPSRGEKSEQRGEIRHTLRARTSPTTRTHDVAWNLKTHELLIWATARKLLEELQGTLEEAFKVKLVPLAPGALAQRAGVPDDALMPTPALVGGELAGAMEVEHGAA